MAKDTLTLRLNGDVPLALFAIALKHFNELVKALSEETSSLDEAPIEWQVSHLATGSAVTTIRGIVKVTGEKELLYPDIEKIVGGYIEVGKALQNSQPIGYSEEVVRPAKDLTSLINGHINSIDFITDEVVVHIKENVTEDELPNKQFSLGVLNGIVRTISDRPRIKLAVYDQLFERVVNCYLDPDKEDLARDVWRRNVSITGMLYRDPDTGRPIEMRDVYSVRTLDNAPTGSFKKARGALAWQSGDEAAEVSIRRVRDA